MTTITADNYFSTINNVDLSTAPEAIRNGHGLFVRATNNGQNMNAFTANETIQRVVNTYLEKLNSWAANGNKPADIKPKAGKSEEEKEQDAAKKAAKKDMENEMEKENAPAKKKKKLHTSQSKRKTGRKAKPKSMKAYPINKDKFIEWFRKFKSKYANMHQAVFGFNQLIDAVSNAEGISLSELKADSKFPTSVVEEVYRWRSNFLMFTIINSKSTDEGNPEIYEPGKKTKSKKTKVAKKPTKRDDDNATRIEKVPTAVSYINRYRLMNGKTLPKSGRGSVLSLLNSLQKAIEEKLIRKEDKYAAEINTMQKSMVNLVNNWTGNRASKIAIDNYDNYMSIVRAYVVAPLTMLIKRFIKIQGKDNVKTEAANLVKAIEKHIDLKEITKPDVADMLVSLNNYIDGKTSAIEISTHALNGLRGLTGLTGMRPFQETGNSKGSCRKNQISGFETIIEPDLSITVGDLVETPLRITGTLRKISGKLAFIETDKGKTVTCPAKYLKKANLSLNGPDVINSIELKEMKFNHIGLKGKFGEIIGDPCEPWSMMLYGSPGSGKSTISIELAHMLASEFNRKVAYVAKEEGIGATIKDKFDRLKAYHANIDIYSNRLPDQPEKYNYIFIDSVNEFGIEYEELSKLQHDWKSKGINPIYIFKGTKDGNFRGSLEFEHLVDVSIKTEEGIAKTEKSRFGGKGAINIFQENQNECNLSGPSKEKPISNQHKKALEIFALLKSLGYKPKISGVGTGRIDVEVEIGTLKKGDNTIGRVGVFWNQEDKNHKISYLGAGEAYSDGYEIHRHWTKPINNMEDIDELIKKDIKELKEYHLKYFRHNPEARKKK